MTRFKIMNSDSSEVEVTDFDGKKYTLRMLSPYNEYFTNALYEHAQSVGFFITLGYDKADVEKAVAKIEKTIAEAKEPLGALVEVGIAISGLKDRISLNEALPKQYLELACCYWVLDGEDIAKMPDPFVFERKKQIMLSSKEAADFFFIQAAKLQSTITASTNPYTLAFLAKAAQTNKTLHHLMQYTQGYLPTNTI